MFEKKMTHYAQWLRKSQVLVQVCKSETDMKLFLCILSKINFNILFYFNVFFSGHCHMTMNRCYIYLSVILFFYILILTKILINDCHFSGTVGSISRHRPINLLFVWKPELIDHTKGTKANQALAEFKQRCQVCAV